jgi:hypothetical protein
MSDVANFIARWGRLKRVAELKRTYEGALHEDTTLSCIGATNAASEGADAEKPRHAAPVFDPASLPSIDSITASTDIRAFLEPLVPPELARSALRRAWLSDPVIRNFIGIAENQWDFNDPAALPGFGPLQDTEDEPPVAQAIARLSLPLDESAALPPNHCAATEERPTAADNSQRTRNDDKTGQAQVAFVTQKDREASDPNQLETGSRRRQSREGTSPGSIRNAHGSAMPR